LVWEQRVRDTVAHYQYEGRWMSRPIFGTEAVLLLDNTDEIRVVVEGRTLVPLTQPPSRGDRPDAGK
jgi:hypothetical protein